MRVIYSLVLATGYLAFIGASETVEVTAGEPFILNFGYSGPVLEVSHELTKDGRSVVEDNIHMFKQLGRLSFSEVLETDSGEYCLTVTGNGINYDKTITLIEASGNSDSASVRLFRGVMMGIVNDDLFKTNTPGATICLKNARYFIQCLTKPSSSDSKFTDEILSTLRKPLSKVSTQPNSEKIWTDFHKLRSSEGYIKKWKDFCLCHEECDICPIFYQHVTLEIFEQLLQQELGNGFNDTENVVDISEEEENALRYMAGYVIRKLNNGKNDVNFLIETEKERLAELSSEQWINLIDRGGLVHVTEECHQLFLSIELVCRQHMDVEVMDENFHKHLENMIFTDDNVLFNWIMTGTDDDDDVLQQIVKLWLNIRGPSFAKSIMEQYKKANKKGTGKSKGLRTRLFTDQL